MMPAISRDVSPSVLQTDPTRYRCPADLPDGAVLIVGSGASGCQIADELLQGYDVNVRRLAADGVRVVGRVVGASRDTVAIGADVNQLLDQADQAYADFLSAARQYLINHVQEVLAEEQPAEPTRLPAAIDEVDSLNLATENINTIIWATGYAYDLDWVKVPVFDKRGRPAQHRGVTQRPGLYFLGLHWMHTFKSGLFSGVGADAEYLAEHMARTR
jgi:putative flavoprotein involved in K+ transport